MKNSVYDEIVRMSKNPEKNEHSGKTKLLCDEDYMRAVSICCPKIRK
jgi:hypothetical protein